jgi:hypothetical protein
MASRAEYNLCPEQGERQGEVMEMHKIEIQCPSCRGTGLYSGIAEKDSCAVVCHTCNGTGKTTYSYREFTGRKIKKGVERVFKKSCGYVHAPNDYKADNGAIIRYSEGGCTYEEWLNGAEPKPVKDLYCPYMWDNRGMGNEPLERCKKGRSGFGFISDCRFFADRAKCWEEFSGVK